MGSPSQPWTVKCKPAPASFTTGYACEGPAGLESKDAMGNACLFNVAEDPCEQIGERHNRPL